MTKNSRTPNPETPRTTGVFRRKPIKEEDSPAELQRSIGLWQLTAIGLGAIIGAGIFALAGPVAKGSSAPAVGPAVSLSFIVAGIASACAALSYAEFGGLIPKAGSAYTYGYAVLGEIVGWFIGWDLLLEYTAIVAVVAIGVSQYVGYLVTASERISRPGCWVRQAAAVATRWTCSRSCSVLASRCYSTAASRPVPASRPTWCSSRS